VAVRAGARGRTLGPRGSGGASLLTFRPSDPRRCLALSTASMRRAAWPGRTRTIRT